MRPNWFGIPLVAAIGLSLTSCVGVSGAPDSSVSTSSNALPKHPVTEIMTANAAKLARTPAQPIDLVATAGEKIRIGGKRSKPQFVLFILEGCPCSIDAQPIFNSFAKHWKGEVDFVGVINSTEKIAKQWVKDYTPVFPVTMDPNLEAIHAYGAKQSVYSALVSTDGKIVQLWPGYSRDLIKDMNLRIAEELGKDPIAFDSQYAPTVKTSGCLFPGAD